MPKINWSKVKVANEIPPGAVQVHLYDSKNVLMPRGSLEKESIGSQILERLRSEFLYWTDPKYGDNPSIHDLLENLYNNLNEEKNNAWSSFINQIKNDMTPVEQFKVHLELMSILKPKEYSDEVNFYLDKVTNDLNLFAYSLEFIKGLERNSSEYSYFLSLHVSFMKTKGEAKKMKYADIYKQASSPDSEIRKFIEQNRED